MSGQGGALRIGLVGLGFGREFVPIYLNHPAVESLTICDPDEGLLAEVTTQYDLRAGFSSFEELLDQDLDAIHLVTPIPLHARQAVAVLESGKHCACTVPMATSLEDIESILSARRRSGKSYMMMETAIYTREYLYVADLVAQGALGGIQFLRGAHYQDMENWPAYWRGLPPMHYATHALAPVLELAGARATEVHCVGSGGMRRELQGAYGNPYPIETAIFRLSRDVLSSSQPVPSPALAAEVTRSLFHTAHGYTESFNVYGERMTFEWQQLEEEDPLLFEFAGSDAGRGRAVEARRVRPADRADLLPEAIRRFTRRGVYDESNPHGSFLQGGGHGGSHPHLVHEFVSSIVEGREPAVGAVRAAQITAAGICAHRSAMETGRAVEVPSFDQ